MKITNNNVKGLCHYVAENHAKDDNTPITKIEIYLILKINYSIQCAVFVSKVAELVL